MLPYEVTKPGYVPRTFYVPARVVNKALGRARASSPAAHEAQESGSSYLS